MVVPVPTTFEGAREMEVVEVREYREDRDRAAVEEVERECEVGSSGGGEAKMCLFTDLLGDPLCRIRNSPAYLMLVAETANGGGGGNGREIIGLIRGCVKTVVSGGSVQAGKDPIYSKVAYILGLRVSPRYRRKGVGKKLVGRMEEWFRQSGAEYSYMATEQDNEASVRLFTGRCGYSKFRTPSVLVHPVFGHALQPSRNAAIRKLEPREAELLYRWHFAAVEFFPADIDAVLSKELSLGTFLAVPAGTRWESVEAFMDAPPASWAVMSVWNCMDAFRLEVRGAPRLMRAAAVATRLVDRAAPWLKIPSIPNLFAPFGLYFLYGVGGAGPASPRLVRALCRHAHNMARKGGCGVVATEVSACEPVRAGVPHWARLGAEDLWCIKRLADGYNHGPLGDWTKAPPGRSIFVDPREF
ncbi:probable N-acetyltransferase HLS1 [Oryza sativa Japonica Group]|uniref:Os03g0764000 protein n=6 Tax=Oryza TaxID=4527 RepID=A0A0P0W427_ORYSJ|nr:probable N-acetyltransferase HLS1 [Oryza sativa Japonica Group]KAB8093710.1 hypothetical protein EE612_020625 [Oryza sativa]KAF2941473.1 hypothetical protein DAI22_03g349300 [Oryza sativa Japonica Group]BAS86530.1 Os03g0764000 [Oryza sativa Japonica Group]